MKYFGIDETLVSGVEVLISLEIPE